MSPIATRSLRAEKLTIGAALRRLGRFWWLWIVLGTLSSTTTADHVHLPLAIVHIALATWGIDLLISLGRALPKPWSMRLTGLGVFAVLVLVADFSAAWALGHARIGQQIGNLGVLVLFAGYVLVMGDLCSTIPGADEVVRVWHTASRALACLTVCFLLVVLAGGAAEVLHQTVGPNAWTVALAVGGIGAFFAGIAALLMTARATMLTRLGFESGAARVPLT